ncbi:complement resistance protein TraT [Escherichia coli]
MSETIWLEPASERTVFLEIKNTSDKDMSGLQGKIAESSGESKRVSGGDFSG